MCFYLVFLVHVLFCIELPKGGPGPPLKWMQAHAVNTHSMLLSRTVCLPKESLSLMLLVAYTTVSLETLATASWQPPHFHSGQKAIFKDANQIRSCSLYFQWMNGNWHPDKMVKSKHSIYMAPPTSSCMNMGTLFISVCLCVLRCKRQIIIPT